MNPTQIQQLGSLLKTPAAIPGAGPGTVSQLAQQSSQWNNPTSTPATPTAQPSFLDTLKNVYNKAIVQPSQNAANAVAQGLKDTTQGATDFINAKTPSEAAGSVFHTLGGAAGTALSVAGAPLNVATNAAANIPTGGGKNLGDRTNDAIKPIGDFLASNPVTGPAFQELSKIPNKDVQDAINLLTVGLASYAGAQNGQPNNGVGNGPSGTPSQLAGGTQTTNAPTEFQQNLHDQNAAVAQQAENSKVLGMGDKTGSEADLNQVHNEETAITDYKNAPAQGTPVTSQSTPSISGSGIKNFITGRVSPENEIQNNPTLDSSRSLTGNLKLPDIPGITKPTPETINDYITNTYDKAIKPTVAGTAKTPGGLDAYRAKTVSAVNTIVDNKPNLTFTTEDGIKETNRLPTTLNETVSAIDQTKNTIYEKYNALSKAATGKGVTIDLGTEVAPELDTIINNKALAISHPEAISYAEGLKARLEKIGPTDPTTVEQVIQNYNNSLKNFYRNPTYTQTSQAAIDALVANKSRAALDSSIESASGPSYQDLKNQYGALKAIEADVTKRSLVDSRKNAKGLIDYTDILSGGDVVRGIVTADPSLFAKGVAQKGIAAFYKYLNDPNRQIAKMFQTVDQLKNPQ